MIKLLRIFCLEYRFVITARTLVTMIRGRQIFVF